MTAVTAIAVEVEVEFAVHEQPLRATLDAKQAAILGVLEGLATLGLMPADTTPRSVNRGADMRPETKPATAD